jgi:hypothetical protein
MNNLIGKCVDKSSDADLVMHRVTCEMSGRPFVVELMASDPMHAIQRAKTMPINLWKEQA